MNKKMTNLKPSLLFGFFVTLPFVVLELINMNSIGVSFPFVLFAFLWVLATACMFPLIPLARNIRAGRNVVASPFSLILRVSFVVLIAIVWTGIVNDQMPCFLGVPNCD